MIKVTVWLNAEYTEWREFHMMKPEGDVKEVVTAECNNRYGKKGWCYYDIEDIKP